MCEWNGGRLSLNLGGGIDTRCFHAVVDMYRFSLVIAFNGLYPTDMQDSFIMLRVVESLRLAIETEFGIV